MQTHIFRSVVLASSLVLLAGIGLSLLIPQLQGNWSQTLTITGTVETGNFTPSGLECEKQGSKDGSLTWSSVAGAESYNIYHRGPRSNDYDQADEVKAPSTTYEPVLSSYFRHRWYVTASYGSWESDPTDSIRVYCRPDVSSSGPKKLQGESLHSQRTVELTWEATPGAILYGVVRADEEDGIYDLLDTTTDNSYTDTSVADGVTYYYMVVALDDEGIESDPSDVVVVEDDGASVEGLKPTPGDAVATPTPITEDGCESGCPTQVKLSNVTVMIGAMGTVHLRLEDVPEPGIGAWSIEVLYDRNIVVSEGCAAHDGSCNPDYEAGLIRVVGTSGGKSGSSTLASISFTCLDVGASGLAMTVRVLQNASGDEPIAADIQDGGVTCMAPAGSTPEPTAAVTPTQLPTATPTLAPTAEEPTATPEPTVTPTPTVEVQDRTVDPSPTPSAVLPDEHSTVSRNGLRATAERIVGLGVTF